MQFKLEHADKVQGILEYFNYFHDGFIKRFDLISQDYFDDDGGHVLVGLFDVNVEIAHYNYGEKETSPNNIIKCRFIDASDVCLDLRPLSVDSSIQSFEIIATERSRHGRLEPCFSAKLVGNRLDEKGGWPKHEMQMFTFREAFFEEVE